MLSSTPRTFVGSTTFTVRGLDCDRCREAVAGQVAAVAGVTAVILQPGTDTVTVCVDRPVDRADIAAAIGRVGYAVVA